MTRLRDVSAASTRCAWLVYPTETLPQRLKAGLSIRFTAGLKACSTLTGDIATVEVVT